MKPSSIGWVPYKDLNKKEYMVGSPKVESNAVQYETANFFMDTF